MRVREVMKKDFDEWLKLRHDLWSYHTLEELEKEMHEIFKRLSLDRMVYIAEISGSAIGFIELSIHETAIRCKTNNVGFLKGWYVKPEYRRKGYGRLLVQKGEAWAVGKGCSEMGSDTTEKYPISPIAHKALGFEEAQIPLNFVKSLDIKSEMNFNDKFLNDLR